MSKDKPSATTKPSRPVTPKPRTPKPKPEPEVKKDRKHEYKPATNPEAREKQLVNLAINLAEKQLLDGTASPSVINHFLKMGSNREMMEREMMEKQTKLIEAKSNNIGKDREAEELTKAAIEAMKNYKSGS